MIVRRLASRRLVKSGSTQEEPPRRRAIRFVVLIFGTGAFAGAAAAIGIWPFGSFQALYAEVAPRTDPPQLSASTIFPTVGPIHKTVDVYQTPPPVRRSQPSSAPTTRPTTRPSQSPRPSGSPRPSVSPTPDH